MAWTQRDMQSYRPLKDDYLNKLYTDAKIPENDPEGRAKYLAEDVLGLTMTDHGIVMRTTFEKGRPAALNMLERWAIIGRDR